MALIFGTQIPSQIHGGFQNLRGKVKIYLHKNFFYHKIYAEQKWKKLLAVGCGTIIHI